MSCHGKTASEFGPSTAEKTRLYDAFPDRLVWIHTVTVCAHIRYKQKDENSGKLSSNLHTKSCTALGVPEGPLVLNKAFGAVAVTIRPTNLSLNRLVLEYKEL